MLCKCEKCETSANSSINSTSNQKRQTILIAQMPMKNGSIDQNVIWWNFNRHSMCATIHCYPSLIWIITGPFVMIYYLGKIQIDSIDSIKANCFPNCEMSRSIDLFIHVVWFDSFAICGSKSKKYRHRNIWLVIWMCLLRMSCWHNMNIFIS